MIRDSQNDRLYCPGQLLSTVPHVNNVLKLWRHGEELWRFWWHNACRFWLSMERIYQSQLSRRFFLWNFRTILANGRATPSTPMRLLAAVGWWMLSNVTVGLFKLRTSKKFTNVVRRWKNESFPQTLECRPPKMALVHPTAFPQYKRSPSLARFPDTQFMRIHG